MIVRGFINHYVELQKNLFKKRTVLLKANEKNFDESMQISLKKRAEKDAHKVNLLLDEKIQIQSNLLQIIEQHHQRLLKDVYKPLDLAGESVIDPFEDIPEPQLPGNTKKKNQSLTTMMKQAQVGNVSSSLSSVSSTSEPSLLSNLAVPGSITPRSGSPRPPLLTFSSETQPPPGTPAHNKISPRKRISLEDEPPIDPNEPVYCYCGQVSWGEMVACDGGSCPKEWFHLACVELNAPPEGKWYCKECSKK